jgi:hypothetical protein
MYRPRIENTTDKLTEFLRDFLATTPYAGHANASLIVPRADALDIRVTGVGSKHISAIDSAKLQRLIDQMIATGEISYGVGFKNALAEARKMVPHFDASTVAAEKLIITRLYKARKETGRDFSFNVADDLAAVIERLGQDGALGLSDLGQRQEAQARGSIQQRDQHAALVKRITGGREAYPQWSPEHGKAINIKADTLATKTLDELIQIEREVTEYRQLRNETREEQRERLQEVSRANGRVDANNSNPATAVGTSTGYASAAVDRSVGGVNPFSDSLFLNPATGREYTRAEVHALVASNPKIFRRMMSTDLGRINRILAGQ